MLVLKDFVDYELENGVRSLISLCFFFFNYEGDILVAILSNYMVDMDWLLSG